ncbi:hypothetical protein [Zoogloea sp.]|uniref:hypothetical protein n=1 Tax=Zoogloea sp. TaxID=49181 RepID=UPI0031FC02B9
MAALLSGSGLSHARPCAAPGPGALSGDFDGDGRPDRVWMQPAGSTLGSRVRAYDPWRGQVRAVERGRPALVVAWGRPVVAGGPCALIQNPGFFSTPIWDADPPPLAVLPHGAPEAQAFAGPQTRRWRGDGILLGTEAGVDILLYWDGRRFRIAYSSEQP